MTLKVSILAVVCAFGFTQACPPDPKPPGPDSGDAAPPPVPDASVTDAAPIDAGPPTDYDLACLALKTIGCTEGQKTDCALAMKHAQEGHINDFKPKCLIACVTKACVHACGKAVACP